MSFFADGVQAVPAQRLFDRNIVLARWWPYLEPLWFGTCCDRDSASLLWIAKSHAL